MDTREEIKSRYYAMPSEDHHGCWEVIDSVTGYMGTFMSEIEARGFIERISKEPSPPILEE